MTGAHQTDNILLIHFIKIGSYRCHDLAETECLISQLGSGPGISTSGSGFYSVDEYREILQYADDRGIEVIGNYLDKMFILLHDELYISVNWIDLIENKTIIIIFFFYD